MNVKHYMQQFQINIKPGSEMMLITKHDEHSFGQVEDSFHEIFKTELIFKYRYEICIE